MLEFFRFGFCLFRHDTIELWMKDVAKHFEQGSDIGNWIPRMAVRSTGDFEEKRSSPRLSYVLGFLLLQYKQ
jgi:hypothetical protein